MTQSYKCSRKLRISKDAELSLKLWSRNIIVTVWNFVIHFSALPVLSAIVSNAGINNRASYHPRHHFLMVFKWSACKLARYQWEPFPGILSSMFDNKKYLKSLPELRCVSTPEHNYTVTKQNLTSKMCTTYKIRHFGDLHWVKVKCNRLFWLALVLCWNHMNTVCKWNELHTSSVYWLE